MGLGFRVSSFGCLCLRVLRGFRVWGLGFRGPDLMRKDSAVSGVQGVGFDLSALRVRA